MIDMATKEGEGSDINSLFTSCPAYACVVRGIHSSHSTPLKTYFHQCREGKRKGPGRRRGRREGREKICWARGQEEGGEGRNSQGRGGEEGGMGRGTEGTGGIAGGRPVGEKVGTKWVGYPIVGYPPASQIKDYTSTSACW